MTPPLSLSMLKMEKNFIAVIEKKYPRKPYEEYSITDMIGFVRREQRELLEAMENLLRTRVRIRLDGKPVKDVRDSITEAMWEIADVSNTLDYLFEALLKEYRKWESDL